MREYKAGYESEYDGANKCLIPGFVNAHAHPHGTAASYAEKMALSDWLFKKIFPFEATLTEEECLLLLPALLCGDDFVRLLYDKHMYYKGEAMAKAFWKRRKKQYQSAATVYNADALKTEYKELLASYKTYCDRLKVEISVHAPYTSNPEIVREFSEIAVMNGCNLHIHLSETLQENMECKEKYGCTPTEYFEKNGAFRVPVTAAHCVYLEDGDLEILKKHGATVATARPAT
jgi:5-methylthioadenosine/S-adenosylhomocysteine deaminase